MFTANRHRSARNLRPTVDGLEGRELLSTLAPDVGGQGALKVTFAAPAIQGNHIGTNVATPVSSLSFQKIVIAVAAVDRKM